MKIEIRTHCKVCGTKLGYRQRTFCSKTCRESIYYQRYKERITEWTRNRLQEKLKASGKELVQCLICGRWYIQLGNHVFQVHKMSAREYREEFNLEVKRGTTPAWFRKLKGDIALENETYKNLKAGKKFRFKKGDLGLGKYKRSPVTMERLKTLHTFNKKSNN